MRHLSARRLQPLVSLLPLLLVACSGGSSESGPTSDPDSGYFESAANQTGGSKAGGGVLSGAPSAGPEQADGDNAAREIAEADIIQLEGTTLYAMSRSGGLSVIDISRPNALTILGRYRTSFTPFEMYVKEGVVFAMYSDWGQFVQDEATDEWLWTQSSSLLALDVSKPSSIQKISQFDLPGEISDSRMVGDVLYAVSYQNGNCWGCSTKPATNVVSINVAKPSQPLKIDELAFETEGQEYGWGKRSITVTPERIYVAGPEYGYMEPENSTIQVVDIADPGGDLIAGATVTVKGQITSRWQMDEYEGTLRVISQPWTWWNNSVPPVLQTFLVSSSQTFKEIGRLALKLPRAEQLQSVRFDGERGYAVTFERTDPLFTFDLSDPAAPKQVGELEMPGFLYHMEPRGDRMIGLGYDQGNPEGAITVSIFDVTDLAAPSMLQRVNFGGTWGNLPEDQDRIHKAFKLDAENGLMLVPFSGWQPTDDANWCGQPLNGVQIIDWAGDALALRGMTTSQGQARRAFIAGDALFTVAEQEVAAYNISDRDKPLALSAAPLALNVSLTLPTGDKLVRLRQDWYSADMRLEVVPQATPDALVASATFNLTDYLRQEHGLAACSYWYPSNEPLFAVGDTVWALINDYGQWNEQGGYSKSRSLLVGFSAETGEVTGSLELAFQAGYWGWGNTSRVVRDGVAFLMQEGWDPAGNQRHLSAVDLTDPTQPRLAYSLPLPANEYYFGSTGLLESGQELITSYAQTVPGKENVVRHFALRIDVSEPLSPTLIGSFNIPGYLVDFDAASDSAVSLDHQPVNLPGESWEECNQALPNSWFDEQAGLCRGHTATLKRLTLGASRAQVKESLRLDELVWSTPRRGNGRLFFTAGYYGGIAVSAGATDSAFYGGGWSWASQKITVVDSATLLYGAIEAPGVWNVVPSDQSLILAPSAGQPLTVIDGSDAEHPQLRVTADTALGYTTHLSLSGSDVFLSQGDGGVQHMTLP